jgi:hypothetical protein
VSGRRAAVDIGASRNGFSMARGRQYAAVSRPAPHHLAQANLARFRAPVSDPSMRDFVARIAETNALAERSRGFVWRYRSSGQTAAELLLFSDHFVPFDTERLFFNMSGWETVEGLRDYVFRTAHAELLRDKARWMADFEKTSLALWWVPAGHVPTVAEARERLQSLEARGPTVDAFTFAQIFARPVPA